MCIVIYFTLRDSYPYKKAFSYRSTASLSRFYKQPNPVIRASPLFVLTLVRVVCKKLVKDIAVAP